jgi:hypothetical protein
MSSELEVLPPPLVLLKPKAKRAPRPKAVVAAPVLEDSVVSNANIRQVEELVSDAPPRATSPPSPPTPEEMPVQSHDKSLTLAELLLYGAIGMAAGYTAWSIYDSYFVEQPAPRKSEEENN